MEAVYRLLGFPRNSLLLSSLSLDSPAIRLPQLIAFKEMSSMATIKSFALLALAALIERAVSVPQGAGKTWPPMMRPSQKVETASMI